MASATTTATPNVLTTLGFQKVTSGVSWYQPDEDLTADNSDDDPTLIIVCSWAFAQPKHIAKYIQAYKEIYPCASILLVQNIIANSIWKPDSWQMSFFQPAAAKIQEHLSATARPRVLLHAFSNGGSHAAVQLSQACRETCGGMRLPVDALLLDSCPGQPRFAPTIAALTQGIPTKNPLARGVGTILAYAATGATAMMDLLNVYEPAAWKLYRRLNDPDDVFLLRSLSEDDASSRIVPRTYLYSKSDQMIMWADVIDHATIAKEKLVAQGVTSHEVEVLVRLEEFPNTAHVNHVKDHSKQYWNTVKETWDKAEVLHAMPN